jgi:cell division protein FtsZ
MISYSRDPQETIPTSSVKIIGLGGAGANMLERVALDGVEGAELLALNTDIRTLAACVAGEKIQLGVNLTKGLGAGGDPVLGQQAMQEAEEEIRAALRGRRIVFLCTGLGGGTGSGAAPIVTRIAREEGAFVVVFATMPFAFEGRRRREQADTALNELAVLSNALVTFDNNRMGELVLAKQGIHEAFAAADHMICESIKAVIRLVIRPGLINVGLDDLMSALRTTRSRCLFGSGIANGKDRAARALRNALASPLLDQGALLKEAQTVLVHLSGGEDLTLYEIELLMQRLQKFVPEKAHVLFGAAVDPTMGDSLSVTLISALPEDSLAGAPRDALSHASPENPILDPSDGFTAPATDEVPAAKAAPAAAKAPAEPVPAAKAEPIPVAKAEPKPKPRADPEPAPERKPQTPATPAPLQRKPEAAAEPPPKRPAVPAAEAAAPVSPALLFDEDDDSPFGESAFSDEPPPVKAAAPEAEEKPAAPGKPDSFSFVATSKPADDFADDFAGDFASPEEPVTKLGVAEKSHRLEKPERRSLWPAAKSAEFPPDPEEPDIKPAATSEPADSGRDVPKLKLGVKGAVPQSELSFDTAPRGRFEGESPNVVDGEDLDLPPFLRKKKQG